MKNRKFIEVIAVAAIIVLGFLVMPLLQTAKAATVVSSRNNLTMPAQLYSIQSAHGTASTASPEAFSIAMPEALYFDDKFDTFMLWYQTSSVTDEWTIETVYTYTDTNSNSKRDSFQCTATGMDASSPWHMLMWQFYGEGN